MPKVRPPPPRLAEWRKVLHGIHRLEERMIALEGRMAAAGTLRLAPVGARVINDSAGNKAPWVRQMSTNKPQRG
jgi:hypothetical protein